MLIADTNEAALIMSEDEITAALALNSNDVYGAAADCCRAIAASAAKSAIAWSALAGELSIDKTNIPKYFLKLALDYDAKVGLNDTTDYTVDWSVKINRIDGKDDSDYTDTDNQQYFDQHYEDGE
jgi:hypothetical protein